MLLELVSVEESGVGDRGVGILGLDLGPVVGMLHCSPDFEGNSSFFGCGDGVFETFFGGDTTDPAEDVVGFVAGHIAIEVESVANDAAAIGEGKCLRLTAAMDSDAVGVALTDLVDDLVHGVAEGTHADEVGDRRLQKWGEVEGEPVVAEVEDQIEFGLLFANVGPKVGENAVEGEGDGFAAALGLGGGLEGPGDFDQVEVREAGAGGGDRGDPVASPSEGLGHVGEGELYASAEAGAEGADGCGDEEDALHGVPRLRAVPCRSGRAGYTLWGGLGRFCVTLPYGTIVIDRCRGGTR